MRTDSPESTLAASPDASTFSVTAKLTLIIMSTTLVSLLVAAVALVIYDWVTVREALVANRSLLAQLIGSNSTAALIFDDPQTAEEVLGSLKSDRHIVTAATFDDDGSLFARYDRDETQHELPSSPPGEDGHRFSGDHLELFYKVTEDQEFLGTIYLQSDLEALYARTNNYLAIVGGVIMAALLVGFAVSSVLQPAVRRPIEELAKRDRELQEINRQLAESEQTAQAANLAKSIFLANMSHELRTPITVITGYTEMLLEEAEDQGAEDLLPDLRKILSSGEHLLGLINDILDLSKIEAGKIDLFMENFEITPMIDEVVSTIEPLVKKNDNTLIVDAPPPLGAMSGDVTRIRQCLFNLLSNAAKFTERGTVTLAVQREARAGRDWIMFRTVDTGIGMTSEQTARLFQVFSQADASTSKKYGGTGLGLAITKNLCRMMGGDLSVESVHGEGTTFTMRIPAETASKQQPEPVFTSKALPADEVPISAAADNERRTVLVIDDDAEIRTLLKRFLDNQGFRVLTASTGEEGIQLAKEFRPMAVTLDIIMPGMDGWAVLRTLKEDPQLAQIPVVVISIVEDKSLGYALGAADYLTKPTDRQRLRSILDKFQSQRHSPNVLIVEDDKNSRDMLRKVLEKQQWSVSEAENGRVALERVRERRPDVILLDLAMPVMDGFQFVRELRQVPANRDIPVIVITGKSLSEQEHQLLAGRVPTILEKGAYTRDELLREVGNLVKSLASEQCLADGKPPTATQAASAERDSLGQATQTRTDT